MEKKLSEMTEEEIQADIEAQAEAKAAAKVAEVKTDLEAQLTEARKELDGLKNKDFDFSKMKEGEKALLDRIDGLQKQITDRDVKATTDAKTGLLDAFAGQNTDLRKKIEEGYAKLTGMPEGSAIEVEARMKEAFTLATGTRPDDNSDVMRRGSSAARGGRAIVANEAVDPDVKGFAENMSKNTGYKITDEDIKKYNKK